MKKLVDYIKENLDVENFLYKFDIWFDKDKENLDKMILFIKDCYDRKIVQKDDVEKFLEENPSFKMKKFVDFFDEEVKRDESINVDYLYLFTKIIETFINDFSLFNKIEYQYQHQLNGEPNTKVDNVPTPDNFKIKKEEN